jgi:hypothetical protein
MTRSVDPSRIPDDAWELYEATPAYRRYRVFLDDNGSFAQKTEFLADDTLVAQNQQEFNDSIGRRFGDGKVVARIPLNVLYGSQNQIAQKMSEGDEDHLRWWLNSEAARPFRTWKATI